MTDYVLEAENIKYSYPDGTAALKGCSLKVKKGLKVALLGSNGAGKSTLFLHFNGILKPKAGNLKFHGQEFRYDKKSLLQLRKKVGIVFQDPDSQLFSASVFQEVSFGPLNLGLSKEETQKKVFQAMQDTGIELLKDKPTHFLSYGQKKRVSIADVLAMEPEVIICDEPNAWLDPKHSKQIVQLFNDINKKGTTVIMSTHDVELAYAWADYVFVMCDGSVLGEGSPDEIFNDDILLKKANLERPWVIDVTNALINVGLLSINETRPRSKNELIRMIAKFKVSWGDEYHDFNVIGNERRDRNHCAGGPEGV